MKTRIWCEFTPPLEVCRKHILNAFKSRGVILNYKLEHGQDKEDFYEMIRIYNDNDIPVSVWATLSDEIGYWINEKNAEQFDKYIRELTEKIDARGLKIKGFCIDMETPLQDIMALNEPKNVISPAITIAKMLTANLNKQRFAQAKKVFNGIAHFLRDRGLESYAACVRHCYYDIRFKSDLIQNALEIPVLDVEWDKYNFMYYSTMIRNEMKNIKKVDTDYLIYHQVSYLKKALKDKLTVSVGLTNKGKLGNEPYYQNISEFEKDMGILKEIGVEDVSLFSLDGILEEKKLLSFLDAMERSEPYKPPLCNYVIRNEVLAELLYNAGRAYYNLGSRVQ